MIKGSVFQMVSSFIVARQGVSVFLVIRLALDNSVCFAKF